MKNLMVILLLSSCAFGSDLPRGNYIDATVRDSKPLYEDSDVCAHVNEVGQKVAAASGDKSGVVFHFFVLNSADVTSFSAPGGYVYVTTGLLMHLRSDDELAVMLGHEIAHINERHWMKMEASQRSKVFWSRVLVIGSQAAGAYFGSVVQAQTAKSLSHVYAMAPAGQTQAYTVTTRNMGLISSQTVPSMPKYNFLSEDPAGAQLASLSTGVVNMGTTFGGETLLNLYYQGYKDDNEFAADKLAIIYANGAGYNGTALVDVLSRFNGETAKTNSTEISHLHSSDEKLATRASRVQVEASTPKQ